MSLFERDGTNKVLGKEIDGDNDTVPAPITGYVTPLALIMLDRLGVSFVVKSFLQKVIWSVAPESTIQPLYLS
jgi:hypothetical protein